MEKKKKRNKRWHEEERQVADIPIIIYFWDFTFCVW
jgi:hypothetical protein